MVQRRDRPKEATILSGALGQYKSWTYETIRANKNRFPITYQLDRDGVVYNIRVDCILGKAVAIMFGVIDDCSVNSFLRPTVIGWEVRR
jgi:hypothetical protein